MIVKNREVELFIKQWFVQSVIEITVILNVKQGICIKITHKKIVNS